MDQAQVDRAALQRVLISNRGEIAIRIARAAAGAGMESVGIFAPVDANALHARFTTRAVEIGKGIPEQSAVSAYLQIEEIIRTAREQGCDCIHPGYGFLAENAEFAERCEAEGLTFIGPSADVLRLFGDKVAARRFAESLGIPVVRGSDEALTGVDDAVARAAEIGYPVMLKAAAGGGGRGMRLVERPEDMATSFARCQSEAEAAFGNGAIFLEQVMDQPRHIEVQVLGDATGNLVHLFDRDCSAQQRYQKVVEIAPAPGLEGSLRERILDDAVKLARASGYTNAGTVEFLVVPETGQHFFIECNPRIQVEHTVTEEVMGVDLVEAQLSIAGGASLADIGLGDQAAVGSPRRYAVQARVVTRGSGTITAYKEPSGPGVRVDACGYAGYAPPPQFDPLLAKVIGSGGTYSSALARTTRALSEFHIAGIPSNLAQLQALLASSTMQAGDARTTSADAVPGASKTSMNGHGGILTLLDQQTRAMGLRALGDSSTATRTSTAAALAVGDGQQAVASPSAGTLLELLVKEGEAVVQGQQLLVMSAMKMETVVAAPCDGVLAGLQALEPGDHIETGQVLAVITASGSASSPGDDAVVDDTWAPMLGQIARLQELAHERLQPDSADPGVVRQRSRGKLTCRERISLLLDEGSFREIGSVAGFASYDDMGTITDFTPANHVGGWGAIAGRKTVVCADDFTSRGGHADGAVAGKAAYLDRLSLQLRIPSVRLLDGSSGGGSVAAMVPAQSQEGERTAKESRGAIAAGRPRVVGGGGSHLPGHLGSSMYAEQLSTVPVVNMLLGSVVGIGAAKAVLGHFSVMVRDISQLFVAGPPVVTHAMGYDITKEDLGDWRIHCRNGSVDNLAESEEEAAELTRRFLSYLPQNVYEAAPRLAPNPDDPADRREEELFTLVPRKRTTTFDIRKAIRLMADRDSFFEIGPMWGTDQVTGFVRFNGYPVGVIASDSQHINGGALTAAGCEKLIRHLDLCDLFHIPVLNLVDNPGFAVGVEHEITGTIRKGGEWMVAFSQVSVPIFTVLMRRSFGVAGNNYATPQDRPSMRVTWPAADVGGIPPEGGIEAAYRRQLAEADDPEAFRAEIMARIETARGPLGPLGRFQIEEVIDPRDTRAYVCDWVETAYQNVSQPAQLGPRALRFRP